MFPRARPSIGEAFGLTQAGLPSLVSRLIAVSFLAPTIFFADANAAMIDYTRDVKPILKSHCYSCHSHLKQKAGLRLDAGALVQNGSDNGPVLIIGKSVESLLIHRITSEDPSERMPAEGKPLSPHQIQALKDWIDQGANFPTEETIPLGPEEHWAFQPVRMPPLPKVKDQAWPRNPIDRFVLSRLEARGWRPAVRAPWHSILRRVHLNLIGLPPTIEEQDLFLANPSQAALDRVIEDLLSRPAYGERWARHWLDLVRYAETNGYERDATKPFVWRYRDYVIQSLNGDKPFDRFIIEQLAGDELPDANAETLIATGYNRLGHWDDEPADPKTDRFDQLDDLVSTTSQVFLGLTIGCARCHDHKFEPLSTKDYYSMVAVFNPLERHRNGRTERTLPIGTRAELRALAERDREIQQIEQQIDLLHQTLQEEFLASGKSSLSAEIVEAFRTPAKQRTEAQRTLIDNNAQSLTAEIAAIASHPIKDQIASKEEAIAALRRITPDLPQGYFLHEPNPDPATTHVLLRGNPNNIGPEVAPAMPAIVTRQAIAFPEPTGTTSRRRLTMAQWIANPENPLTARVIVNRIWQRHFGLGLVRTPSDFGVMGARPTHPLLLDWLAHWFVHEADWSIKKLHRLILSSQTYRMSTASHKTYAQADPDNLLFWRMPYRRLEVEAIRDSILATSGQLNGEMFGPSMYPSVPRQALEGHSDPDLIWKPLNESEASRRTIFAFIKRSMVVPMLEVLDLCDTVHTSPQRMVTTVAPQALTLFNGEFVNRQARHFAARLLSEAGPDSRDLIDRAYRLALGRPPTNAERHAMLAFLKDEANQVPNADAVAASTHHQTQLKHQAIEQMCRVILNLNEFVYVD